MNDLINREWLIKQLETEKEYRSNSGEIGAEKGLCYALEIVDDMPSVQQQKPDASVDVEKIDVEKIKEAMKNTGNLVLFPAEERTLYGYKIEHLAYIAMVMEKEGVTAEYAVKTFDDMRRAVKMILDEAQEEVERSLKEWI